MSTAQTWPNGTPGSDVAVAQGCTCPRRDNQYGDGAWAFEGEMQFWMAEHCPVHGFTLGEEASDD